METKAKSEVAAHVLEKDSVLDQIIAESESALAQIIQAHDEKPVDPEAGLKGQYTKIKVLQFCTWGCSPVTVACFATDNVRYRVIRED